MKEWMKRARKERAFYRHAWGYGNDEDIGILKLTCPKCHAGELVYAGGNMLSRSIPIPGHEGLRCINGGPLHFYQCTLCEKETNWSDIPEDCWEVEICLRPAPRYDVVQEPLRGGTVFLYGPNQRKIG